MKNIYLLFLSCCCLQTSFSQEVKDSTTKKDRKIYFKVFYAPSYCFKKTQSDTTQLLLTNTPQEDVRFLTYNSKDEIGLYGYEMGFLSEILLSKNVFIDIGLSYERMGYRTRKNAEVYVKQTYQMFPYVSYDTTNSVQIKRTYNFISVPLTITL